MEKKQSTFFFFFKSPLGFFLVSYSPKAYKVSQTAEKEGTLQDQEDKDQRQHLCHKIKMRAWVMYSMKSQRESHVSVMQKHVHEFPLTLAVTVKECMYFSRYFSFSLLFTSGRFLNTLQPVALHLRFYYQVTING